MIWRNVITTPNRWMAYWLRRRGWVCFYLDEQARTCGSGHGGCWLALYQQSERSTPISGKASRQDGVLRSGAGFADSVAMDDLIASGGLPEAQAIDPQLEHRSVTVARSGEEIVTIETNCLSGRDISDEDEQAIEWAIEQLRGFIGPSADEAAADDEYFRSGTRYPGQ